MNPTPPRSDSVAPPTGAAPPAPVASPADEVALSTDHAAAPDPAASFGDCAARSIESPSDAPAAHVAAPPADVTAPSAGQTSSSAGHADGAIKPKADVAEMFGRIVRRYDLMNRLMTGGQDVRWRRRAVAAALGAGDAHLLDVATGTGDLAIALADGGGRDVVGLDVAPRMIAAAEEKRHGRDDVAFLVGDAMHLPFPDASFDAVTVSFGLRNMPSYLGALTEMTRVVKPGGRLVCLELTPYQTPVLGALFGWYFRRVVPLVGGALSGDREAYRYLPTSVASFPDALALKRLMLEAGLAHVEVELLGTGTVALHVGIKRSPTPA